MFGYRKKKGSYTNCLRSCVCIILTLALAASLLPGNIAAQAAQRQVEWGRFQNSPENNGVTDAPAPSSYQEAVLKWAKQMVQGGTISFTPPLIIDGDLYTASNQHVYRIDRETGDVLKESEKLKLNVGYALNPITYDPEHDLLFVPILNGCISCLDLNTLKVKWTSKPYPYTQTLCPITYRDGRIFTGLWAGETKEGCYLCLDALTGEELWNFSPSDDGGAQTPRGFYWDGACCTDRYLVFGSDDGQNNTFAGSGDESYQDTAALYSVNPKTGELIDRIDGCRGDIRTTVVYHEGALYWTAKGGKLYKVSIREDGSFDKETLSYWTAPKNGIMTGSPVIYKGRIYIGAAGSGGQYSSDGGHIFAVLRDDEKLSQDSLIYSVPIPGYPQASPLLSNADEAESGKVRLYFTFNAYPGGIYYLEDDPQSTADSHAQPHLLFRPEKEMQQYCISPICADREGTLYIKNDSGYLMAVASNKVWLDDLEVSAGSDPVKTWDTPFESGYLNYRINLPNGTESVYVKAKVPEGLQGVTLSINGKECAINGETHESARVEIPVSGDGKGADAKASAAASDNSASAEGSNGTAGSSLLQTAASDGEEGVLTVPVTVARTVGKTTYRRTYTLRLETLTNNANLAGLAVSRSNTAPKVIVNTAARSAARPQTEGTGFDGNGIAYDPVFDASITDYTSAIYDGSSKFINIWPKAADEKAVIRVFPEENVANGSLDADKKACGSLNEDGSIPEYTSGSGSAMVSRYPVYWVRGETSATVRIEVTSPSGKKIRNYRVTLLRTKNHTDIGGIPLELNVSSLALSTRENTAARLTALYGGAEVTGKCLFYSVHPEVATVDPAGNIAAGSEGSTVIWVSYDTGEVTLRRSVQVTVKEPQAVRPEANLESGTYRAKKRIVLGTNSDGAQIRYVMGSPEEELKAPTTTTGTVYQEPIEIGVEGEKTTVRIRAIACGNGYKKSEVGEYTYVIDLTGENPGGSSGSTGSAVSLDTSSGSGLTAETAPADGSGESASDLSFPNGTSVDTIGQALAGMRILAHLTDGSIRELDSASAEWNLSDMRYDPDYIGNTSFYVDAQVTLPTDIDANGSSRKVRVRIRIGEGSVAPPQASPRPGNYTKDLSVSLSCGRKGASILYTISGSEKTQLYRKPIPLQAEEGKTKTVEIRAYALVNDRISETVSLTYTLDKTRGSGGNSTENDKPGSADASGDGKTAAGDGSQSDNTSKTKPSARVIKATPVITLSKKTYTYTGKAIRAVKTVKANGKVLKAGTDYTITYRNHVNAGTASATVTLKGSYSGKKTVTYVIGKAKQPMSLKAVTKKISYKKVKKKKQTVTIPQIFRTKAKGKLRYTRIKKGSDRNLTIQKTTGVISVKKGTPKGKHRIRLKVYAAGDRNHLAGEKSVTVTVVVR